MKEIRSLGEIGAELSAVADSLAYLEITTKVNRDAFAGVDTPTERTRTSVFFAIEKQLERIAEEVNEWEGRYLELKGEEYT